jgi:hypothetical protein
VLAAADYTVDSVDTLLGSTASQALRRHETTPARRRTADGSPLATLIRLFLLQTEVARSEADRALPGLVDGLVGSGVLEASAGEVRALLDCRPYADDTHGWWLLSDLTPGLDGQPIAVTPDHVLGVTPASTSLTQLTIRHEVERSLDLGTGCGVQALHLSGHTRQVVATDVNPRALALTRFNAALNEIGASLEVRDGSLWEPVDGQTFDLVTSNPPFVISPPESGDRLVYRDSGLPGDEVVEVLVRGASRHLADDGWCHLVANWAIGEGQPWDERLAGWLPDDCDALVIQREVLDPPAYVELWLKDAGRHGGAHYVTAYDAWLSWFEHEGMAGVGFGWVNLHKTRESPVRELLDHPYAVEQPVAPAVAAWAEAQHHQIDQDDHLSLRVDVVQETHGDPGAEDPETIVLRQRRGLCRARQVDTVEAALAGACDGDLSLGQIIDALSTLLERDRGELAEVCLSSASSLVREGFLGIGNTEVGPTRYRDRP